MFRTVLWLLTAGLGMLMFASSTSAAVTLTSVEDNYVFYQSGGTGAGLVQGNGGADGSLQGKGPAPTQGNARTMYFKFDTSSATPADGNLATLTLTASSTVTAEFSLALFALNQDATGFDWSENAITWNNSPGLGITTDPYMLDPSATTSLGSFPTLLNNSSAGTSISFTFENWQDYVQSDGTLTLIAVVVSQSSATPAVLIASSENGDADYRPELFISVPEPGRVLLLLTAIGWGCFRRRRTTCWNSFSGVK